MEKEALAVSTSVKISKHLNNILILRDLFFKGNLFPAYSDAMELPGCSGNYHPDYIGPVYDIPEGKIHECLKSIKEI